MQATAVLVVQRTAKHEHAECRQTRTKNQHQARVPGEIPPLEAEVRGTVPDEVCSDTT